MAAVSALIAETVAGLKKVVDRDQGYFDFDDEPPKPTNRGNKLKRKSEYFHEGELGGTRQYKKRINHAGYSRYIVHRNVPHYGSFHNDLDDDDDEEEEGDATSRDPYRKISIESILMPLTAAAELENHPTLSLPYKSEILNGMLQQACTMIQKERKFLVELKVLLTRLRGDHGWIPCGSIYTDDDFSLFSPESLPSESVHMGESKNSDVQMADELGNDSTLLAVKQEQGGLTGDIEQSSKNTGQAPPPPPPSKPDTSSEQRPSRGELAEDAEDGKKSHEGLCSEAGTSQLAEPSADPELPEMTTDASITGPVENDRAEKHSEAEFASASLGSPRTAERRSPNVAPGGLPTPSPAGDEAIEDASPPPRMLTRGQAQAQASAASVTPLPPSRFPSVSSPSIPSVHPLFLPPPTAIPDRDHGLPSNEAEDTRRILSAVVQKQEEVVRGAEQLYDGLLTAQRLAKTVWAWCKAEGHKDEMSDGEDWVDNDEWGLDGPLKKGQEEVEDTSEKKTRGRRGAL